MFGIRKFVVGTGAAGLLAAGALLLLGQTSAAATPSVDQRTSAVQVTPPSAPCTSAIQAIKEAVVADRSEDLAEWHLAKAEGESAVDQSEDAAELGNFKSLFAAARTACAPAAPVTVKPAPSAQCTAAAQALKAAWAQGRPTTKAQSQQLQTLFQAVRSACGFTWSR